MKPNEFAALDDAALAEVFGPTLDRLDFVLPSETLLEGPEGEIPFKTKEELVSFLLDKVKEDEKEDVRLALERETI